MTADDQFDGRPALNRRGFLSMTGGLLAAGALAACGSNTGRSGGSTAGGSRPTLAQWYHQYGEAGTQQAVQRYAKAYPKADVSIQWTPGDYDKKVAAALLTSSGPDIFEAGNGPSIDQIQSGQWLRWTACSVTRPATSPGPW